jgi:hypothetical protein
VRLSSHVLRPWHETIDQNTQRGGNVQDRVSGDGVVSSDYGDRGYIVNQDSDADAITYAHVDGRYVQQQDDTDEDVPLNLGRRGHVNEIRGATDTTSPGLQNNMVSPLFKNWLLGGSDLVLFRTMLSAELQRYPEQKRLKKRPTTYRHPRPHQGQQPMKIRSETPRYLPPH